MHLLIHSHKRDQARQGVVDQIGSARLWCTYITNSQLDDSSHARPAWWLVWWISQMVVTAQYQLTTSPSEIYSGWPTCTQCCRSRQQMMGHKLTYTSRALSVQQSLNYQRLLIALEWCISIHHVCIRTLSHLRQGLQRRVIAAD